MPNPLVSVVIPCYNAARFLRETVDSALTQTWQPVEVIAVDDGSTDKTREVLASYGGKIRVAREAKNRGVSAARNRGTELAHGTFIQFLDSDDLLRPEAIARRVEALESSGADVAYGDWQKLEPSQEGGFRPGAVMARRWEDVNPDLSIAWFTAFWCPPAALLYRRSIVDRIGGWNERLPVIQDARYALDAALRGGRFVYVPGVGADYRVGSNGGTLSRRDPLAFVNDVYTNACEVESWWEGHGGLTKEQRNALVKVHTYSAQNLFWLDEQVFRENMKRLYRLEPGFRLSWPKAAAVLARVAGVPLARRAMSVIWTGEKP